MKDKLKVYGGTYDGRNRVIVAAPSKRAAYDAISKAIRGVGGYKSWDAYTSDSDNEIEVSVATASPLTVFIKDERIREAIFTAIDT